MKRVQEMLAAKNPSSVFLRKSSLMEKYADTLMTLLKDAEERDHAESNHLVDKATKLERACRELMIYRPPSRPVR